MQVELSNPPLFDELRPLFERMSLAECRKVADFMINDASEREINKRWYELQQESSHRHMGDNTAPYEGSDND